jgi:hypothetical protein
MDFSRLLRLLGMFPSLGEMGRFDADMLVRMRCLMFIFEVSIRVEMGRLFALSTPCSGMSCVHGGGLKDGKLFTIRVQSITNIMCICYITSYDQRNECNI